MAVVIHYVDKFYKNRIRFIALRHLRGGHDGENQTVFLVKIIKEYDFKNRFGYFVSNNITSCDIVIDVILCILLLILS